MAGLQLETEKEGMAGNTSARDGAGVWIKTEAARIHAAMSGTDF